MLFRPAKRQFKDNLRKRRVRENASPNHTPCDLCSQIHHALQPAALVLNTTRLYVYLKDGTGGTRLETLSDVFFVEPRDEVWAACGVSVGVLKSRCPWVLLRFVRIEPGSCALVALGICGGRVRRCFVCLGVGMLDNCKMPACPGLFSF